MFKFANFYSASSSTFGISVTVLSTSEFVFKNNFYFFIDILYLFIHSSCSLLSYLALVYFTPLSICKTVDLKFLFSKSNVYASSGTISVHFFHRRTILSCLFVFCMLHNFYLASGHFEYYNVINLESDSSLSLEFIFVVCYNCSCLVIFQEFFFKNLF